MAKERKDKGLAAHLGDPVPEREAIMWAELSVAQRAKAMQRMTALQRWIDSDGAIDAKQAAADAGVSVTRMYEMAKAWREKRSLASLGTFAGAPKTRVGKHDAALRRALPSVVAADPKSSVRKLALDLEGACGIPAGDMPSHNTLRRYVEEELRRLDQKTMAGDDVMLDCAACTLTPTDTVLLTLFAILDRWTQVVLGAGFGDPADSRGGYALAARDALRRLDAGQLSDLPWVERMSRAEIVVGLDEDRWGDVRKRFADDGIAAPVEPSTREKRFGRYLRSVTGLRIGSVVILPRHTEASLAGDLVRTVSPTSDQVARLRVEVDRHNSGRTGAFSDPVRSTPPADLHRMLALLARG
ncbi:MAG TPA: hypothetical protein VGC56_07185 [Allosphingosinicella sp.]|jgi:hypothetical protein